LPAAGDPGRFALGSVRKEQYYLATKPGEFALGDYFAILLEFEAYFFGHGYSRIE
jgi:hypothetical protein